MRKWATLAFLCLAFFFYMSDRQLFGLLVPLIQEDTGLSKLQIGLVDTVLYWNRGGLSPHSHCTYSPQASLPRPFAPRVIAPPQAVAAFETPEGDATIGVRPQAQTRLPLVVDEAVEHMVGRLRLHIGSVYARR